MKIISLNTWGGRAGKEDLLNFIRRHKDIDVFCLQEIWEGGEDEAPKWGDVDIALMTNISAVLENHSAFFRPHYHDYYGIAIFIKKSIKIEEEGDVFVFKEKENVFDNFDINHPRNLQYIKIETVNGPRTIINFHGLWNGKDKKDSAERFVQSDNIVKFLKNVSSPYVMMGDFNLEPETESIKKLEALGMRNLITEFGVTSTRSSHYKKPVRLADYTFLSKDIKLNEFKVLPDEISDHLAMYLDFE